ncbi:MAG: hypothetical protein ABSF54_01345 [Bryobacteraceae bacterium]|jgi:hypothetical protein
MSTAAPSPSLRSLFSELEQLFQSETEARVSTSVQAAERALAEHLNQSVRRLRQAAAFPEIAAILCDASVPFANACAVFRISENTVAGERLRGASGESAERFREIRFAASEAAAFAGAIESGEPVVALCSPPEVSTGVVEAFAHAPGDKAHLFPLTVDRTTVGMLYATGAVDSAALELLAQATAAVMEARQRQWDRPPSLSRSQSPDLVHIEPAALSASPAPDWDDLSPADRHLHLRAQRFARLKVAEMRLYRPDAVKSGRAQQDLYSALQDAIDVDREAFRQTFLAASKTMVDYFHLELVRTLAQDNPAWLGGKYPGRLA